MQWYQGAFGNYRGKSEQRQALGEKSAFDCWSGITGNDSSCVAW